MNLCKHRNMSMEGREEDMTCKIGCKSSAAAVRASEGKVFSWIKEQGYNLHGNLLTHEGKVMLLLS